MRTTPETGHPTTVITWPETPPHWPVSYRSNGRLQVDKTHHSMRVLQTSPLNYRRTFAERKVGSHCVSLRIPWPRRIDPLYPRS